MNYAKLRKWMQLEADVQARHLEAAQLLFTEDHGVAVDSIYALFGLNPLNSKKVKAK